MLVCLFVVYCVVLWCVCVCEHAQAAVPPLSLLLGFLANLGLHFLPRQAA